MGLESGLWCGWADPHARPHGPFARRDLPQQFWGRVAIDARRNAIRVSVAPPAARRRGARPSLDTINSVLQNRRALIEFTQSARKHRVGRARVRRVMANPVAQAVLPAEQGRQARLVFVGDDESGRALEVMAVRTDRGLLVIHAMDLRPKWRALYEEAK